MGQQPVMWTNISPRKPRAHLRYKNMALKVAAQEETPQRRPNMDPRGMLTLMIHLKNPLVRELTVPRNCPTTRLVHILRGEERGGNIPREMTLKSLRKTKPPTFDGEIKKGEEAKVWLLDLKKYLTFHDYYENLKAQISIFNLNGKVSI
jgi:hypothetical protein